MLRQVAVLAISLSLGACAHPAAVATFGGSTGVVGSGSACGILHSPEYAIKGKTNYDQAWINKTTEGLVSGCAQPRPQVRPASMDAAPTIAAVHATTPEPTEAKQVAKRKKWFGF